jgi:hypothetical protein
MKQVDASTLFKIEMEVDLLGFMLQNALEQRNTAMQMIRDARTAIREA